MLPKRLPSTDFTGFKIDDDELAFYLHGRKRWELDRRGADTRELDKALGILVKCQDTHDLDDTMEILGYSKNSFIEPTRYLIVLDASITPTDALVYNESVGWVAESRGEGTAFLHAEAKQRQIQFSPSLTRLEVVW